MHWPLLTQQGTCPQQPLRRLQQDQPPSHLLPKSQSDPSPTSIRVYFGISTRAERMIKRRTRDRQVAYDSPVARTVQLERRKQFENVLILPSTPGIRQEQVRIGFDSGLVALTAFGSPSVRQQGSQGKQRPPVCKGTHADALMTLLFQSLMPSPRNLRHSRVSKAPCRHAIAVVSSADS